MALATRFRGGPSAMPASDGSRTMVLHDAQPREEGDDNADDPNARRNGNGNTIGVLRLRGARRRGPRVAWTEDVVDNEGLGRKKSKICCIYHKPRQFDESSSESSDSDSDSDGAAGSGSASSGDDGRARPGGRLSKRNRRQRPHSRPHSHPDGPANGDAAPNGTISRDGGTTEVVHELGPDSDDGDVNAYEKLPGKKGKGKEKAQPEA